MNNSSRSLPPALAELFRRWQPDGVGDAVPEVGAVFSAGHSNRSFLVRYGAESLVVRVPDARTEHLGIDRKTERRVLALAEKIGLGAQVLHLDERSGLLVTRFLESRPLRVEGIQADETIDRLAEALRRLHGQNLKIPLVNVADRIRAYARTLQRQHPTQWARARKSLGLAQQVMEQYRFVRWRDALCHHDLVAQNILEVDGGVRFIDWEYASRGDPFFDLATLVEDCGFNAVDRQRLLLAYGEIGDAASERLYQARVLHRLLSVLWYLLRQRPRRQDLRLQLQRQEGALKALIEQHADDRL